MAVILFDGVCNLCNAAVNFVIDHDPARAFRFAPLQSEAGQSVLAARGVEVEAEGTLLQSLVLVEGKTVYRRSTAALRIARRLAWPWPLLYALIVVPRPLRDRVYDAVARRRYDWFGRRDHCRMPTPALQDRFLATSAEATPAEERDA